MQTIEVGKTETGPRRVMSATTVERPVTGEPSALSPTRESGTEVMTVGEETAWTEAAEVIETDISIVAPRERREDTRNHGQTHLSLFPDLGHVLRVAVEGEEETLETGAERGRTLEIREKRECPAQLVAPDQRATVEEVLGALRRNLRQVHLEVRNLTSQEIKRRSTLRSIKNPGTKGTRENKFGESN